MVLVFKKIKPFFFVFHFTTSMNKEQLLIYTYELTKWWSSSDNFFESGVYPYYLWVQFSLELNYHQLASLNLGFDPNSLHGGS